METVTSNARVLFGCLLLASATAAAQGLSSRGSLAGFETGATAAPGAYKSYASVFLNTSRKDRTPVFLPGHEGRLYGHFVGNFLTPRYVLLQATLYPLAATSSFVETYHPRAFARCEVAGLNVLRALGSGTEEPYAISLLLGNLAFLGYHEQVDSATVRLRQAGSALAGLLFSGGNWHIHDNICIKDPWWQVELILTGTSRRQHVDKMSWNFRLGVKVHTSTLVPDVVALTVFRDHTRWDRRSLSLLQNSRVQYEAHFPFRQSWQRSPFTVRQLFTYGKKFPLRLLRRAAAVRIGGGLLWEWVRRYDHQVRAFAPRETSQLLWLIQPSLEF
ncbi:MAG: hypothetical protein ACUVTG_04295 [Candidatus Oleimicrobiaceae bacterium]